MLQVFSNECYSDKISQENINVSQCYIYNILAVTDGREIQKHPVISIHYFNSIWGNLHR